MESEGYGREEIHAYLEQAGGIRVTKTHGRRSVAGLNQMDNCLSNPFFLADSADIGPYIRILIIFNYIHSSTLNIWTDFSPFCS